jgi:hypothetical protein
MTVAEVIKSAAEVAGMLREYHAEREAQRVNFDGGPRETPEPPPPTQEQFLTDVLRQPRRGDGSGW